MKIYVPVHTHCSECGNYSGYASLGVAFTTLQAAEEFLRSHPNPDVGWGNSTAVNVLELDGPSDK